MFCLCLLAALLSPAVGAGAQAQFGDPDVLRTCELYQIILSTGGDTLTGAAEELRELGSPNPAGIEGALDSIIAAESAGEPDADDAVATLDEYYGGICNGIDQCPIVQGLVSNDRDTAAAAAAHLRDLNRPNPPGIAIALQGLIDPETDPDDYAQFRVQASDWFAGACEEPGDDAPANDGTGDDENADDAADDELAYGDDGDDGAEETESDDPPSYSESYSNGDGANGAGNTSASATPTLPATGFGTVGLFLAFAAFVAFTLGATLISISDR